MDIAILGGRLINPATYTDEILNIGIKESRISYIGSKHIAGNKIIDATGKVVAPGFIDIHVHEDSLVNGTADKAPLHIFNCMARMGVTTCLGGNCGTGKYPTDRYINRIKGRLPINFGMLLGYNDLRRNVVGLGRHTKAFSCHVNRLISIISEELKSGLFGVSVGLEYDPGITTEEILAVGDLLAMERKLLSIHYRYDVLSDSPGLDSMKEMLYIAEKTGAPVQISHIGSGMAMGEMVESLKLYTAAKSRGVNVVCDCYPYLAYCTYIEFETFTPAVMGKMNLAYTDLEFASGPYAGKTCTEELFLQQRSEAPGTLVIAYIMNEVEVRQAMVHPDVLPASDAILSNGMGHPRSSGTFPRFISKYVREECSISLMEALRKMTSYPAARLNLSERGNLEAGTYADIVIFDYEKIRDTSSYRNCISSPEGISSLIVGGEIVLSEGELAGSTPGEAVSAR